MRMIVNGIEAIDEQLARMMNRDNARRIVEAGSRAAVTVLQERTEKQHHVISGEMRDSFRPGVYHEDSDKCWQDVYPQGTDSKGTDNAQKAFIINFGRGKRKTEHAGDKFITGRKKELEEAVGKAMGAEAERIRNENMR